MIINSLDAVQADPSDIFGPLGSFGPIFIVVLVVILVVGIVLLIKK